MHFLLPDRTYDDWSPAVDREATKIGEGLLDLFHAWLAEDDPQISVRFISEALAGFQIDTPTVPLPQERKSNQILVARSDETVTIDDSLIPALDWYSATPAFAITEFSLREVLRDPIHRQVEGESRRLPDACEKCRWANLCGGGDLENRYSIQKGFNNRSVYCETYKALYAGICKVLLKQGYPEQEIRNRFGSIKYA